MRLWPIAIVLLFTACGTDAPTTAEQLDLVVTSFDPAFQFNQATTYALPDKVVSITDPGAPPQELDSTLSQGVLTQVRNQLNGRGYTEVPSGGGTQPSIFVEVSKMTSVNAEVYYSYWPTYWGSYYAPYYPGAYGAGWAAVPYPYVSSSTFGSLILNATNPNSPNTAEQKIPTVWVAVLNGIVDGSTPAQIQQRADAGIAKAFQQSPYFSRSAP